MKVYRAIGTVLSSILILVLVLVLVSSLLVVSVAQCVSKDTISNITKTILSNESVKEEISAGLSQALTDMMQSMVSNKPTSESNQQNTVPSGNQQTSENAPQYGDNENPYKGNDDGNESTGEVVEQEITIAVSQERISEILSMPAVQDAVSDLVSDYAMVIIEQKENHNVSCSQTVEKMLADNAGEFNVQIENIVSDCNMMYDDFYDTAALIASENDLYIPDRGASYVSVLIAIIGQKRGDIDRMIETVLQDFLPASDSAEFTNPQASLRSLPVLTATVTLPSDTDSALSFASEALEILQNPKIYAAVLSVILIFFLITAFFTWSFKRPLLFIGIASVLTALCLFAVTYIPMPYDMVAEILAESIMPDNASLIGTMRDVTATTWSAACNIIRVHALSALIIGVLCFIGFGILYSISKKKKNPTPETAIFSFTADNYLF